MAKLLSFIVKSMKYVQKIATKFAVFHKNFCIFPAKEAIFSANLTLQNLHNLTIFHDLSDALYRAWDSNTNLPIIVIFPLLLDEDAISIKKKHVHAHIKLSIQSRNAPKPF